MKVVILAGGYGTRISEESRFMPKPMLEIGERPILWHIMKEISYYGFNEFIICAGYKQNVIKEWFANYFLRTSDVTFDFTMNNNEVIIHDKKTEKWKVTVVDTGLNTMTGGRVKRIQKYIGDEPFILTYGDGIGDINIKELVEYHKQHKKTATISVYNFGQNKGVLDVASDGIVRAFREKSDLDGDLINIGYMVLNQKIFDYLSDDKTVFEQEPLNTLVSERNLISYVHHGFWQCMDTLREKQKLEKLWESGNAPWRIWK